VDLDRIGESLRAVREFIAPNDGTRRLVVPVVKANEYGHGAPAVARRLQDEGADALCIALLEEGIELRRAGITIPILAIGALAPEQIDPALGEGIVPSVYNREVLEALEAAGRRRGRPAPFHLKLDTGMTRLGVAAEALPEFLDRIAANGDIHLEGVFSSLACADRPEDALTRSQIAAFSAACRAISSRGLDPGVRHLANSAAAEGIPDSRFDAVRPGLLIYGIPPTERTHPRDQTPRVPVRPALSLTSRILQIRDAPDGTAVGYGATWVARGNRRLAAIPAGYDDGLIRSLSSAGHALVRGHEAPIAGRISMDLCILDVTDCGPAAVGDEVVLLGESVVARITAWDLAHAAGTIPWEICCRIGGRVPREYHASGAPRGRWSRWSGPVSLAEESLA
jgi:alanine racemase